MSMVILNISFMYIQNLIFSGKDQNSDTLLQLRSLIVNRRRTPHAGVGFWRWAMTVISGNSEIVVHTY